jgi:hypothetical protein
MMTNDEILKLAKSCGFDNFQRRKFDGENDYGIQWGCWEEQLLNFALAIHEDGYNKGYDDGWQGSKVSTEMGTMEFDDE